jgi:protein-disulfide isomerase
MIGTASSLAFGSVDTNLNSVDTKILNFQKERIGKNRRIQLKEIELERKVELDSLKGWSAYVYDLDIVAGGKDIDFKDIVFSNGTLIAPDLIDLNTKESLKESVKPPLNITYYKESHFIAGTKGAKNKIVLFSDPLCPFCMDFIPDVIEFVTAHKDMFEVYYYHLPLTSIHPASETLAKAMIVAHNMGLKDIVYKTYKADFDPYFSERERDEKKILDGFNKVLDTKITLEQINSKDVLEHYEADKEAAEYLMVAGTPTIYLNGKLDKKKRDYLEVVKGAK